MKYDLLYILGAPALVLMVIIIIADSSLLRAAISKIRGKTLYTQQDFEDWLFTVPTGFFWHKLLTCSLCHAFHTSWISALGLALLGKLPLGIELFLFAGPVFLAAYAYLRQARRGYVAEPIPEITPELSKQAVTGEQVEFSIPPVTPAKDWPTPNKNYMSRLVVVKTQKPNGAGVEVKVTGMDDMAQSVTAVMGGHAPCNFPRCEELKAEYNAELAAAENRDCPKCELGQINRKYWDIAIALQGG